MSNYGQGSRLTHEREGDCTELPETHDDVDFSKANVGNKVYMRELWEDRHILYYGLCRSYAGELK